MEKTEFIPFTEDQIKRRRAKKQMMWFAIISLCMTFAGLTSSYVFSSTRRDWATEFEFPMAFWISTGIIVFSSLTLFLAGRMIKQGKYKPAGSLAGVTLILGIAFSVLQFVGFNDIIDAGYYFTGGTSNVRVSFIYVIVMLHLLHVAAGLISLIFLTYNTLRGKYTQQDYLGFELGATFWHFVDILWIYLILFLAFYS